MYIEGDIARRWASDPWRKNKRTCYSIVACTLQATRRGVQDTQRYGLEPVLMYCSLHTGCVGFARRKRDAFGEHGLSRVPKPARRVLRRPVWIYLNYLRSFEDEFLVGLMYVIATSKLS